MLSGAAGACCCARRPPPPLPPDPADATLAASEVSSARSGVEALEELVGTIEEVGAAIEAAKRKRLAETAAAAALADAAGEASQ